MHYRSTGRYMLDVMNKLYVIYDEQLFLIDVVFNFYIKNVLHYLFIYYTQFFKSLHVYI